MKALEAAVRNRESAASKGKRVLGGVAILVLALFLLRGCSDMQTADNSQLPSADAASESAQEHVRLSLRVAAPVAMQGLLEELASAYAADKDWLSFDFSYFNSVKKENSFLKPDKTARASEEGEPGSGSSSDSQSANESAASSVGEDGGETTESATMFLPKAEIVFQSSLKGMDAAEKADVVDPGTRSDMLQDSLVIVASSESKLATATTASIEAATAPLCVVDGKGVHAKRQFEALERIGVYAEGDFADVYAKSRKKLVHCKSTAELFATLASDKELVAIVRTSDVYRYGGVKVLGSIPADYYEAMWFPCALGKNIALEENGADLEETARDFLSWIQTDADAAGIVEKWGYHFAA